MGYHLAFPDAEIVGVDVADQPRYPFTFVQGDAMTCPLEGFDFIHASPPCQAYAPVTRWRGSSDNHPDLLWPTLDRLTATHVPWVVENVPFAPMEPDVVLCGSMFGLRIRRHRWFRMSHGRPVLVEPCRHRRDDLAFDHGGTSSTESEYRDAMGVEWMTVKESRNAIPPAYTEWIGRQLAGVLATGAAA
jgi:DNA (cytosine-5)-methyltransferase 1